MYSDQICTYIYKCILDWAQIRERLENVSDLKEIGFVGSDDMICVKEISLGSEAIMYLKEIRFVGSDDIIYVKEIQFVGRDDMIYVKEVRLGSDARSMY